MKTAQQSLSPFAAFIIGHGSRLDAMTPQERREYDAQAHSDKESLATEIIDEAAQMSDKDFDGIRRILDQIKSEFTPTSPGSPASCRPA